MLRNIQHIEQPIEHRRDTGVGALYVNIQFMMMF